VGAARPLIVKALASAAANWRFLLNHSVLLECEGDLAGARAEAEKAAQSAPERFECWGRLGDLAGKLEDYPNAVAALEKALAAFPGHPALAMRLAGAAYETGDYDRASAALDVFEKSAPGHPQALKLRTHIAREKNDWNGLIVAAKASLAASPEEEASRAALAFAYAQQGHFDKAAEAYRPLAEKTPPRADHLATLGRYVMGARKLDAGAT
jgi:tetratricopeptide (TPR) repeat protein